ncbi:MAG: LytTR family DNA-binding domain-containing protein, partial [Acidobacteriota bacterium]
VRGFLEGESDIEIVAECRDGKQALETIESEKPDLIFLDVQMPEMDGFEVLANIEPDLFPTVIFTTAYDQYALKAFDVHAVDYLRKPFDRERFREALGRARSEVERRQLGDVKEHLQALLEHVAEQRPKHPERLVIKSSGRVVFLKVDDIDWVDAAGNYVKLHAGAENHLLRETMSRLEDRLDPSKFIRIHRSTIVNIERIKELQQQFHGDYLVVLKGGQRLTLSRSYREKIQVMLDSSL